MAIVLVTGGSSGIGLATARRLAAAGDRVYSASRNPQRETLPEGVTPIVLDVTDRTAADVVVAQVVEAEGRLDVLVNNAGACPLGPLEEMGDDEAHWVFEVNLFGPMRLARAAIPGMRAQGGGHIVNITSMNDIVPAPFGGWYSASKAALASASAVLDAEVNRFGISVTVVAPGLFRTEMSKTLESYEIPETSMYRAPLSGLLAHNAARISSAADPDEVAVAIEQCVRVRRPPARVVVGADAQVMDRRARDANPEDFASMLRSFVTHLASSSPQGR